MHETVANSYENNLTLLCFSGNNKKKNEKITIAIYSSI